MTMSPKAMAPRRRPSGVRYNDPPSLAGRIRRSAASSRSEEHTSELQSQSNLVCRLLLEKKKNNNNTITLAVSTQRIIALDDFPSMAFLKRDQLTTAPPHTPHHAESPYYYSHTQSARVLP